jgi:GTPase
VFCANYASQSLIFPQATILFESNGQRHARVSMLLRLPPAGVSLTSEVRCAVVGNVDSGKSSTLGVLTSGMYRLVSIDLVSLTNRLGALDDGRGRARVGLFRHKHEIETGRTSSVGMEVISTNSKST